MKYIISFVLGIFGFAMFGQDSLVLKTVEIWRNTPIQKLDEVKVDSGLQNVFQSENLAALLQNSGVLQLNINGRFGAMASANSGGMGSDQVKVYWEGIELNQLTLGMFDFSLFPAFLTNNVSVNKQAEGLSIGNSSVGSTVSLSNDDVASSLNLEFGSFNHYRAHIKKAFRGSSVSGHVQFYHINSENNFEYIERDGSRREIDHNRLIQTGSEAKFNFKSLGQLGYWVQERQKQLPNNLGQYKTPTSLQYDNQYKVYWRSDSSKIQYQIDYSRDELNYLSKLNSLNLDYDINSSVSINRYGVKAALPVKFKSFSFLFKTQALQYAVNSTGYGKNQVLQYRLAGVLNAVYQRKHFKSMAEVKAQKVEAYQPFVTGLVKLSYQKQFWQTWLSAASKYRIPDFNDLYWRPGGNPDLKNEEGNELAIGAKLLLPRLFSTELRIEAVRRELNNQIVWVRREVLMPVNLDYVQSNEFSIRTKSKILDGQHKLSISYRYQFNVAESIKGNQNYSVLPYLPKFSLGGTLNYQYGLWTLFANYQHLGRRYIDYSNNYYSSLDPYEEINLGLAKKFVINKNQFQVSLNVLNLLDTQVLYASSRPNPGRYYRLNFNFNIK